MPYDYNGHGNVPWEVAPVCTCPHIRIGSEVTEHRNWDPDCDEHGVGTPWWTTIGKPRQDEQNARLRELQAKARQLRKEAQGGH